MHGDFAYFGGASDLQARLYRPNVGRLQEGATPGEGRIKPFQHLKTVRWLTGWPLITFWGGKRPFLAGLQQGGKMRSDELMKPDLFSEVLLTFAGTAMLLLLGAITWIGFSH